MKCPVCDVPLNLSERQGIEIDFCTNCRGIWLERGELDKRMERVISQPPRNDTEYFGGESRGNHGGEYYGRKRRNSFLGELFEIN